MVAGSIALTLAGLYLLGNSGKSVRSLGPHEVQAYQIADALYRYSLQHGGRYPTGSSSTDIFQQLLDGQYVQDPALFWLEMPGKQKPTARVLRPDNVCWDITSPIMASNEELPVVFITGYRFNYSQSGTFTPLFKSVEGRPKAFVWGFIYSWDEQKATGIETHIDARPGALPYDWCADPNHRAFYDLNLESNQKFQQLTPDGPLSP